MREHLSKRTVFLSAFIALALCACGGSAGPEDGALANYLERKGLGEATLTPPGEAPRPLNLAKRVAITIERGENIEDLDSGPGESDPYVILEVDGVRKRSSTIQGNAFPIWGDTFIFEARAGAVIAITLMDQDTLSSDELIGNAAEVIPTLEVGDSRELVVPIRGGSGGTLWFTLSGMAGK